MAKSMTRKTTKIGRTPVKKECKPPLTVEQVKKQVTMVLSLSKGDTINKCYALFLLLQELPSQDRSRMLRYIAEIFDTVQSTSEIEIDPHITANEKEKLRELYGAMVDSLLDHIMKINPEEDMFYENLLEIIDNPLFPTDKEKVFALYYCLIDRRIPYFRLAPQGLRVADDEWSKLVGRLWQRIAKIRFILATEFEQKSEEADLLVRELEQSADRSEKAALMGYILFDLRSKSKRLERLIQERT